MLRDISETDAGVAAKAPPSSPRAVGSPTLPLSPVPVAPQNRHIELFNERVFAFPDSVLLSDGSVLAQRVTFTGVEACGEFRAQGSPLRQVWRRFHQPAQAPRALVFYLHGLHSHSRFLMDHVLEVLTQAGLVVFGLDIEGHGLSDGKPRYFRRLTRVVDAWEEFLGWATQQREYSGMPFFLFGWSLGGTLGIQLSRRLVPDAPGGSWAADRRKPKQRSGIGCFGRQPTEVLDGSKLSAVSLQAQWRERYRGSCLLCPSTTLPDGISPALVAASAALSAVVPKMPIPLPVDYAELDPKIQQYKQLIDRLDREGHIRARVGRELLVAQRDIQNHRHFVRFPFLLLHGANDATCPPTGSVAFYNHAAAQDKELFVVPDMRHELLRDPGNHAVLDRILGWIEQRIVAPPEAQQ